MQRKHTRSRNDLGSCGQESRDVSIAYWIRHFCPEPNAIEKHLL